MKSRRLMSVPPTGRSLPHRQLESVLCVRAKTCRRRSAAKLLTRDEVRRIAASIAKLGARSAADFERITRDDRQSMVRPLPIEPQAPEL